MWIVVGSKRSVISKYHVKIMEGNKELAPAVRRNDDEDSDDVE